MKRRRKKGLRTLGRQEHPTEVTHEWKGKTSRLLSTTSTLTQLGGKLGKSLKVLISDVRPPDSVST